MVRHPFPRLADRAGLSRRTVRWRLTAVYGALFLLCGAGLLAITYALLDQATAGSFSYTDSNGRSIVGNIQGSPAGPTSGLQVTRDGQTPRDGSATLTPTQAQALDRQLRALASSQHAHVLHQLLAQSAIALAIMTAVSLGLGWFVAGRVLRPLRTITELTATISATNLHERLTLHGPDDELQRLGDTINGLLARLDKAFDAQRRFIANASHELRTPLTVVRALLQMTLTDPRATIDTFRATCAEALTEGEQQERLIEALLVLARSERGLDSRTPLDLASIAEHAVQTRTGDAIRRSVSIQTGLHPAWLDGDPRLVERLVANLVDNALLHNVPNGHVDVASGIRNGKAFLSISNSGAIVAPSQISRLLQPFQRLEADSTRTSNGVGLGLSIVAAIAESHDALLDVQARRDGGLDVTVQFHQHLEPHAIPEAVPCQLDVAGHEVVGG